MMVMGLVRFCFNQVQVIGFIIFNVVLMWDFKEKKIQEFFIEDIKEDIISNVFGFIDFE